MMDVKVKCDFCKKDISISFSSWIKQKIRFKKIECVNCEKINVWKNNVHIDLQYPFINSLWDDECHIYRYSNEVYSWIERHCVNKRCAFLMNDDKYFVVNKVSFNNGYIVGVNEDDNCIIEILICDIKTIKIISDNETRYNKDKEDFIIGYKGIYLKNFILGDKQYIYEIGIPYIEKKRSPFKTDYQDVYSHFCDSIEDVLKWRNYIKNPLDAIDNKYALDCRLFRIRAKDHCFRNTSSGWVANYLEVVEEVEKEEIIKYFNNNINYKNLVSEDNSLCDNIWMKYESSFIVPYKNDLTIEEIEKHFIDKCDFRNKCGCTTTSFKECNDCHYRNVILMDDMKDYCYLIIRYKITNKEFNEMCYEFQYLKNNKCKRELEAIERLYEYY